MPVNTPAPTGKSVPHAASGDSSSSGASAIDEQLDPLAAQQLAALAVAGDVLVAAAVVDEGQLAVVLGEQREQVGPVGLERLAALVDVIRQHRHRPSP